MKAEIIKSEQDPEEEMARDEQRGNSWAAIVTLWLLLIEWKRVCSWCRARLGGSPLPLCGTTHTICPGCLVAATRESAANSSPKPGFRRSADAPLRRSILTKIFNHKPTP